MTKLKALPLQTWLVLIVVLVSALGLSASAFAVNGIMRDFAYSNVDSKLQQASKSWLDRGEFQRPGATQQGPPSDFYVLKRFTDGTVLEVNDGSDAPDVSSVRFDERPTTVSSIGNGDHVRWRVLGFTQGQEQTIVAQSLEREDSLLRRLTIVQVFIGFIVLGILGLVAMWAVRRALRPLKEVEHTARDIAAGDLDRRVPQWPMSTEVGQLAAALNIMLTQLQDSLMTAQQK
ncbi:HAMP domain-containing protein, partial [Corynebacterium durum]